jgi:phenylpropionate dioxygenase-like ring-hydroxylating dioxygenase large terminal subunit
VQYILDAMPTLRVDKDRYISRSFLELEREKLWPNVWLCAGRASDAATPGSYFTFELGREVILVVNDAGTLRAFHNVCQHRGHPLRPCGRGNAKALTCPYHGWSYALSGRLEHVPDRHTFPGQVPADEFSLRPLGCEQAAGFAWVHFGEVRESLSDFLAELGPALTAYGMAEWGITQDVTLELSANWKTVLDVWNESYHAQGIHAQILDAIDDVNVELELHERHSRMVVPFAKPSPRRAAGDALTPVMVGLLKSAGLDPKLFEGRAGDVRAAIQQTRRQASPQQAHLSDAQLVDCFNYHAFPNLNLAVWTDHAVIYRYRPHPEDPQRSFLDLLSLGQSSGRARAQHETWQLDDRRIDQVLAQDIAAVTRTQRGMTSSGFLGLHLSSGEARVKHTHAVLDRYLSR